MQAETDHQAQNLEGMLKAIRPEVGAVLDPGPLFPGWTLPAKRLLFYSEQKAENTTLW
ncbi:MAG: hypothetical protein CM1200mP22_31850 [Dehalococcoidia bacterium]|nr:MAG: hypothetical protein CM1200mP22_31850 [Dehalococcoidia bacterium]